MFFLSFRAEEESQKRKRKRALVRHCFLWRRGGCAYSSNGRPYPDPFARL